MKYKYDLCQATNQLIMSACQNKLKLKCIHMKTSAQSRPFMQLCCKYKKQDAVILLEA